MLSVLGVLAFPEIEEMLEPSLGAISGLMTICSLIIVFLIATSIGKMYVRIRA